jgi:hypothetical protein
VCALAHTGALISPGTIDDVLEWQPSLQALDLAQHVGGKRARIGGGGIVRRDGDFGTPPQRAYRRQRFARDDVEARARERTFVERANDIGLDLQRAARGVDQVHIGQWKWADQPSMH